MLSTIVSGGLGLADTLGVNFDSILSNNRDEKRANRDRLQEAIWNLGVSSQALAHVHSDHWKDLQEVYDWIQREGQPAIEFLNESLPDGTGSYWDNKIFDAYKSWKPSYLRRQSAGLVGGEPVGSAAAGSVTGFKTPKLVFFGLVALVLGYLISQ